MDKQPTETTDQTPQYPPRKIIRPDIKKLNDESENKEYVLVISKSDRPPWDY
jgi:hypothetical protein